MRHLEESTYCNRRLILDRNLAVKYLYLDRSTPENCVLNYTIDERNEENEKTSLVRKYTLPGIPMQYIRAAVIFRRR